MTVGLWREHRAGEAWVEIRVEQEKPEMTPWKPFLVFCTEPGSLESALGLGI